MTPQTLYTIIAIIAGIVGLASPLLALFVGSKVNAVESKIVDRMDTRLTQMENRLTERMEKTEARLVSKEHFATTIQHLEHRINDIRNDRGRNN